RAAARFVERESAQQRVERTRPAARNADGQAVPVQRAAVDRLERVVHLGQPQAVKPRPVAEAALVQAYDVGVDVDQVLRVRAQHLGDVDNRDDAERTIGQ